MNDFATQTLTDMDLHSDKRNAQEGSGRGSYRSSPVAFTNLQPVSLDLDMLVYWHQIKNIWKAARLVDAIHASAKHLTLLDGGWGTQRDVSPAFPGFFDGMTELKVARLPKMKGED